jgi:PqqD family protein of HPr-rel-A system
LRSVVGRIRVRGSLTEEQRWCSAADLVWTHYQDSQDWVVFHPQSGDVCLVTSSAHILWKLIADGQSLTLEQLISALAAALERAPDEELAAVTRDTLTFMDRAGLVRPISL